MQRHRIVDPRLHALGPQSLPHSVTVVHLHHVEVVHGLHVVPHGDGRDARHIAQTFIIPRSRPAPGVVRRGQMGELGEQEARLQIVQPVAVADCLVHRLGLLPVVAQQPHRAVGGGVARDHGAAVAQGAEVLARVEAEGGRDAERAAGPPLVQRAVRLAGVFDDGQAAARGELEDRIHVGRLAVEMHRHDRPGARGDRGLDGGRVDVGRVRQAVDEDRRGAGVADRLGGSDEGVDRDDDLVAGADAGGLQGQAHGVGARADAGAEAGATELGEGRLEGSALRTHGVGGARDHRLEDFGELVVQLARLAAEVDKRNAFSQEMPLPLSRIGECGQPHSQSAVARPLPAGKP